MAGGVWKKDQFLKKNFFKKKIKKNPKKTNRTIWIQKPGFGIVRYLYRSYIYLSVVRYLNTLYIVYILYKLLT